MFVRAQNCYVCTLNDGIVQVGIGASYTPIDNGTCAAKPPPSLYHFHETKPVGGTFVCRWAGPATGYGQTWNYIVWRRPSNALNCTDCAQGTVWGTFIAGQLYEQRNVAWDAAGQIAVGGELACGTCDTRPTGRIGGTFAGNGSFLWQRSDTAGGGNWQVIGQANNFNSGDFVWDIDPLPAGGGLFGVDRFS